jgi:hypothetical protein
VIAEGFTSLKDKAIPSSWQQIVSNVKNSNMGIAIKRFWIALIPLICYIGCQDDDLKHARIPDGVYEGTFVRDMALEDTDTANIVITFSSNQWTGASDIMKYPALCNGAYSINGDKIVFQNDCYWTAEFDWTFILSGEYDLKFNGNNIEFSRTPSATSNSYIDIFRLRKVH